MGGRRRRRLCTAPRLTIPGLWETVAHPEGKPCHRPGREQAQRSARCSKAKPKPRTPRAPARVAVLARAEPSVQLGGARRPPPLPAASAAVRPATSEPALPPPPPPPPALRPRHPPRWPRGRPPHLRVRRHPAGAHSGTASGALPGHGGGPTRPSDAWRPRAGGRPQPGRALQPRDAGFSRPELRGDAVQLRRRRRSRVQPRRPHRADPAGSAPLGGGGGTECRSLGSGNGTRRARVRSCSPERTWRLEQVDEGQGRDAGMPGELLLQG